MKRLFLLPLILPACGVSLPTVKATPIPPQAIESTASLPLTQADRNLLTYDDLMNGFIAESPLDQSALTMPADATSPLHVFEGRLELLEEQAGGQIYILRGELEPEYTYLPEFDFEFVQEAGSLIPVQRGQIIADHPVWNIILEPGRLRPEGGAGGFGGAPPPLGR